MKALPPDRRNDGASIHPSLPPSNSAVASRWRRTAKGLLALLLVGLVGTARADLLVNGGFTNGTDPWALLVNSNATAATSYNTNGGLLTINITAGGTSKADVQLRQALAPTTTLIAGNTYKVTYTATAAAPKGIDAVIYAPVSPGSQTLTIVGASYNQIVGTTATTNSFSFTAASDLAGVILSLRVGGNTTAVTFDTVSFGLDPRLAYAPPALYNPVVHTLKGSAYLPVLDKAQDAVIKIVPNNGNPGTSVVKIIRGRNVVMMGGEIDQTKSNEAIAIEDGDPGTTRTVHVEGVLISYENAPDTAPADAIDTSSASNTYIQLENINAYKLHGTYQTAHADVLQTYGGSLDLRIDRLTGESDYQGFFLPGDSTDANAIGANHNFVFKNINLIMDPNSDPNAYGGYALWLDLGHGKHAGGTVGPVPTSLSNFWVLPRPGRSVESSVAPDRGSGNDSDHPEQWAGETNGYTVFNAHPVAGGTPLPVTGGINEGTPPEGDFVPRATVGLNYQPPGYLQGTTWEMERYIPHVVPGPDPAPANPTLPYPVAVLTETQPGLSGLKAAWLQAGSDVTAYVDYWMFMPAGTYTLKVGVKTDSKYGQMQVKLDGANVGAVQDEYSAQPAYKTLTLGTVTFNSYDAHQLVFQVTGKNALSTNCDLIIDFVELDPVP